MSCSVPDYAVLTSYNKNKTAVHCCHFLGMHLSCAFILKLYMSQYRRGLFDQKHLFYIQSFTDYHYLSKLVMYSMTRYTSYGPRSTKDLWLEYPKCKSYTKQGDRAINAAAPTLWKQLPTQIRNTNCLNIFIN